MKNTRYTWSVPPEQAPEKLSRFLADVLPDLSHTKAKTAIENGLVSVDGEIEDDILAEFQAGQEIELDLRQGFAPRQRSEYLLRGIDVIHEDSDIIVVNKPPGILVHQTAYKERGTLIELIHRYWRKTNTDPGYLKPVHRIDKDTSGLVIFPRNAHAHQSLLAQFKKHTIQRSYLCLAHGLIRPEQGTFKSYLSRERKGQERRGSSDQAGVGKQAVTHYRVQKYLPDFSIVECQLETGRTHQIRIHLSEAGHPLVGEKVYISKALRKRVRFPRQALHAYSLTLLHPKTQKEIRFQADLPEDMHRFIKKHQKAS